MLKILYRLKMTKFVTIIFLGLMSFALSSCSEEVQEDNVASATPAPEISQTEASKQVVVNDAQTPDDIGGDEVSDAGFLDYDMVIGDVNAPVEMIEYASFTCNHCATFHNDVLPRIKEKYVDTGKVKIIIRSYMLNRVDANISQLTRCVSEKRFFAFNDILFNRQQNWYNVPEYMRLAKLHGEEQAGQMFTEIVRQEINKIARQVGMNQKKIDACGSNEEIGKYLFAIQSEANEKYKVAATPTIIVNGKITLGNDYRSVEKAIEEALN